MDSYQQGVQERPWSKMGGGKVIYEFSIEGSSALLTGCK
jgi:hypothetical protein